MANNSNPNPNPNLLRSTSICPICKLLVFVDGIFCEICLKWNHIKCLKMTRRQYNSLHDSPLPFFCNTCLSDSLPLLNLTQNKLIQESFNSNKQQTNNHPCNRCKKIIGNHRYVKCKLGNHLLHNKCANINTDNQHEINYKIWSCNECVNFPFQDLNDNDMKCELTSQNVIKAAKPILFENNFHAFKQLQQLNINLESNESKEQLINFEYYDMHNFLKLTKSIGSDYLSILHTNIRSYNKNHENLENLLTMLQTEFDILGVSETWDNEKNLVNHHPMRGYHQYEGMSGSSQNSGVGLLIRDTLNYTRRDDLSCSSSGKALTRVENSKYLGVIIDSELNWKEHLRRIHTRIKQNSGIIKKIGRLLPRQNLLSLYYSLIHPHFNYCITSWGSPDTKSLNNINITVNKCINYINSIKLQNENNFNPLNINTTFQLESCKLIHKFLNNNLPSSLNCLFSKAPAGNVLTRRNNRNNVTIIHHNQADHPIMFYGPQSWNHESCYKLTDTSFSAFCVNLILSD